ncbi:hypothetical protein [Mucilaginibacter terrae]|uniref:Outer membrane protein beta-barrel domain-containing protein n=1 Tax=Mucilaginibacter terrae TaxID=1955052 RepID=A0ABU3GUE9_9SPHI|nr:hypothetical protein [Mucilaginibacter terrae]MDT3403086.1 hypothetical protein [Mucilaginibacter terrae]
MKKYYLLIAVLTLTAQTIYAQQSITKAISIGPELNIPQRSGYNIGYGASANAEVPVSGKLAVVVTGGYHKFSYKNFAFNGYRKPDADSFIPLKAGVKYYADTRLYLQGEVGAVLSNANNSGGSNSNLFAYSLGTGFLLPMNGSKSNMIDIGLRFEDWSQNRLQQFAIRVAYRFGF